MTNATRRLWAIVLVGVLLVGAVAVGALTLAQRTRPVSIVVPSPPTRAAADRCADLVHALPEAVDGHGRRATEPESPFVRAWGRPAIVAFCGVGMPAELTPTSELLVVDEIDWLPVEEESAWRFTTVGRVVNVQVLVPKEYAQPVNPLVDLAAPIQKHAPLAR